MTKNEAILTEAQQRALSSLSNEWSRVERVSAFRALVRRGLAERRVVRIENPHALRLDGTRRRSCPPTLRVEEFRLPHQGAL